MLLMVSYIVIVSRNCNNSCKLYHIRSCYMALNTLYGSWSNEQWIHRVDVVHTDRIDITP